MATRLTAAQRAALFAQWQCWGRKVARDFYLRHRGQLVRVGMDLDDCRQVALLAMHEATVDFDPSKGFSFSTFAKNRIVWALWPMFGRDHSPATVPLGGAEEPGTFAAADVPDAAAQPVPDVAASAEAAELVRVALLALPPRHRRVLVLRAVGRTLAEVADGELSIQRIQQLEVAGLERLGAELRRRLPVTCAAE